MPLDLAEAANMLGVSSGTVRRWARQGRLGIMRPSGEFRFEQGELRKWARNQGLRLRSGCSTHRRPAVVDPDSFPLSTALDRGSVLHQVQGASPGEVLSNLVELAPLPESCNRLGLLEQLQAREALASTALSDGVALPHPRKPSTEFVSDPMLVIALLEQEVDWNSMDGKPVHTAILLINPTSREHLQVLSRLAFVMREPAFPRALSERVEGELLRRLVNRLEGKTVE
ncbi:MAG: PTS transporter subunit EIIA [Planctomycetes bacterium]|nr:PTS transporter subunit EIIA [Planctomycetota bacterium]MCP4770125.1 PTS transporter subunit EIIA [Planctomycetota bacterium]MCP4860727.1 PTS transporter subunit EIIA [Planctomycetota bacterium]